MIGSIDARPLAIPFRQSFKHASASRAVTQSILVVAKTRDGVLGYGEGCPREYVTGESISTAQGFIARHRDAWCRHIGSPDDLRAWMNTHAAEVDTNPAAWAAVEIALLDLFGKLHGCSVEALLGLPRPGKPFRYTAVIGDGPTLQFEAQLARYRQVGFRDFKIKLAGERQRDRAKTSALRAAGVAPGSVRADANNLWRDSAAAIEDLKALDFAFCALEEPLPARNYAGMALVGAALDASIILDESVARAAQLDALPGPTGRWVANVRVSKMGGVLRSLEFLTCARERGLRVIVGAHVGETSLLTRTALVVAQAAGDALLAQEGAFGTHLLEHDVVEPPLMFGPAGILDACAVPSGPGWGVHVRE